MILELCQVCTSFIEEVILNRKDKRDAFEIGLKSKNITQRFKSRNPVAEKMLCLLYEAKDAHAVVAFLVVNLKKLVIPKLQDTWGLKVSENFFTAEKLLWLHFFLGSTYSALKLLARGIKKVSENALTVDNMKNVRTYRDSLTVGKLKVFENPEGDTAGRVWPHMDMLPRVFEFEEITKAHDVNGEGKCFFFIYMGWSEQWL